MTTGYGRLVTAKVALLCLLALAGALHRGRTLPDLDVAARDGSGAQPALEALRRLLRVEVALLLVVFALTAVLAGTPPPSSSDEPARATAPFGSGELQVVARPGHPGANDLRIAVPRSSGGAALAVVARQRRLGLGPIVLGPAAPLPAPTASPTRRSTRPGRGSCASPDRAAPARPCACACAERTYVTDL